jgi:hypothetical protein
MEKYDKTSRSRKEILSNNFIGGFAWGFGVTIGLAVLFVTLGIISRIINPVPVVGNFVSEIINFVLTNNPNL